MIADDKKLRIYMMGQFRLDTPQGQVLTPTGAKARALLALLVTDGNLSRSRVWLQDKLWSDRAAPQASASLRQALVEIRKSLGVYKNCLLANRHSISLDPAWVQIIHHASGQIGQTEFLEGLDAKDPEFEDWLRQTRASIAAQNEGREPAFAPPSQPSIHQSDASFRPLTNRKTIVLLADKKATEKLCAIENQFVDLLYRSLGEIYSIDIKFRIPEYVADDFLQISVQAFQQNNDKNGLRVVVEDGLLGPTLFSDVLDLNKSAGDIQTIEMYAFANNILTVLSNAICALPTSQTIQRDSGHLAALAMRKMFSMQSDELDTADRLLEMAMQREEKAIFYALKAQAAVIRHVEQSGSDFLTLKDISSECCAKALSLEPYNSSVLCSVANALLVFEHDTVSALELSRISVQANPANPFAWWASSNARLYAGQGEHAYEEACMSQKLAARSNFRFWSDFQVSLTAAVTGKTEVATKFGRISSALAPKFRPPLRYLTAIYANSGDQKSAAQTAKKLKALENSFTMDALANDKAYPASQIRKAGLVENIACLLDIEI